MKRRRILLLLLAIVLLGGGAAYWRLTAYPPSHGEEAGPFGPAGQVAPPPPVGDQAGAVETPEAKTRRQLLGTWQDEYRGKRTMTLNGDGTGTMLVELSGLDAILAAPRLHFNMKWSVEGKTLTKKTVSGEPANKVNMILNTMGDTAVEAVLELTDERLLLLDKDGKTEYDWRRMKTDEPDKK
jgi:hypothetical protein